MAVAVKTVASESDCDSEVEAVAVEGGGEDDDEIIDRSEYDNTKHRKTELATYMSCFS